MSAPLSPSRGIFAGLLAVILVGLLAVDLPLAQSQPGNQPSEGDLQHDLTSRNTRTRRKAVEAFAAMDELRNSSIMALGRMLADKDDEVRHSALAVLKKAGQRAWFAYGSLVEALESADAEVKEGANSLIDDFGLAFRAIADVRRSDNSKPFFTQGDDHYANMTNWDQFKRMMPLQFDGTDVEVTDPAAEETLPESNWADGPRDEAGKLIDVQPVNWGHDPVQWQIPGSAHVRLSAGVFAAPTLQPGALDRVMVQLEVNGAGRDQTVLVVDRSSRFRTISLTARTVVIRNCTIDCQNHEFLDVRFASVVLLENVRVMNYASGAGGSNAVYAHDGFHGYDNVIFDGSRGRTPRNAQPFDIRSQGTLVYLHRCEFRDHDYTVVEANDGYTMLDRCRFIANRQDVRSSPGQTHRILMYDNVRADRPGDELRLFVGKDVTDLHSTLKKDPTGGSSDGSSDGK